MITVYAKGVNTAELRALLAQNKSLGQEALKDLWA